MPARLWTCGVLATVSLFVLVLAGCAVAVANHSTRAPRQTQESRATRTPRTPTPIPTATPKLIATPTPTRTPAPTPTPTPTLPSSNASSGASSALDIVSPEWNEVFYVRPGETLSQYITVQKPAGTTHWCSRTSVNYDGTFPSAPGLVITDACEIRWTPTSSNANIRYEVGAKVLFQWAGGNATHYRTFYVEVTNNPPAPTATPPAPAPVNNEVLGIQIGTTPLAPITLDVTPIPPILVVTSSVTIDTYTAGVGEALGASFVLKNNASFPIPLAELVLGGRLNGVNDCSNYTDGACPDFTKQHDVVIEPGAYHVYVGSFTPQLLGTYDFQVFYRIADRWYWNVPTENGAVNQRFVEMGGETTAWEALAQKWATYYSLNNRLLKAVVEAEAVENIAGDYDENGVPHAFGYGQVWPKWHYASIQKALLDATGSPVSTTDEQTLGNLLLASNDASMAAAALVVRETWIAIGTPSDFGYSTFEAFTKKYVGPAISDEDLTRRWNIWQKHLP